MFLNMVTSILSILAPARLNESYLGPTEKLLVSLCVVVLSGTPHLSACAHLLGYVCGDKTRMSAGVSKGANCRGRAKDMYYSIS